jgi:mRNA interferase MazF
LVTPAAAKVVLVHFPFSDLSTVKASPSSSPRDVGRGDWVLCQITSNPYGDRMAEPISDEDFTCGSLDINSYARPGKLFTASSNLMVSEVGILRQSLFVRILNSVRNIFR